MYVYIYVSSNVGSTFFHAYNANAADAETCLKLALALPAYSCPEIADSGLSYKGARRPRVIVFISLRDTPPAHQCVPLGPPWQTSNGEPWHLQSPRHAARKSTDSPPGPVRACTGPSTCGPTARAVGGWWLALCRRALGATWSCGGGRGRLSFSCAVCFFFVVVVAANRLMT